MGGGRQADAGAGEAGEVRERLLARSLLMEGAPGPAVAVWGDAAGRGLCARRGAAPVHKTPRVPSAQERALRRKLLVAVCLSACAVVVELAFGAAAGSLAIMTDAAHMASDTGASEAACRGS